MADPPSLDYASPPQAAFEPSPAPSIFGLPRFVLGLVLGGLLLLVAGAAAVTVFILAAGHGTVLDRMVPSDAAAYVSVNLDPPADQKLDLLNLSHKLPMLSTQQNLDQSLDRALKQFGLSYRGDVQPWLGSQVVALAGAGSKPDAAVLLDSRDDAAAQRTMSKLEARYATAGWQSRSYSGVTLRVGTVSGRTAVLAYFDHALLVAGSTGLAQEIVDTDHGKHARLDSTAEYRTITGRLPSSRLITVYADGHRLSGWTPGLIESLPGTAALKPGSVGEGLTAFRGLGFAVAAQSDGLVADAETDIDASQLPADQRALFERQGRENPALQHVPSSAVAVVGLTDLDVIAKSLQSQAGTLLPAAADPALGHLTGDAAITVEPEGQGVAFGAVIGSTDPAGLRSTVQSLAGGLMGVYSATAGQDLIVASSAAELSRLQAAGAGGSFESTAAYRQAASYAVAQPVSLVFLDVDGAFRLATSAGVGGSPDFQQARTQWSAVHSVLVTVGTRSARAHVVIG